MTVTSFTDTSTVAEVTCAPPAVLDMQAELELPVLGSRVCVRDEYTVALPGPEPLNRRLRTNTGLSHRAIR